MAKIEQPQTTVSRTFRAAIRVGEDFYTVEETLTLPPSATDDEIAQAIAMGERIYLAQRAAAEAQIRELRDQVVSNPLPVQIREPDAPASDKQRQYMDYLVNELGWDGAKLQGFAAERQLDILTLTKREASELIDQLKTMVAERHGGDHDRPHANTDQHADGARGATQKPIAAFGERATVRQVKALERLAEERGVDIEAELADSYDGRGITELTLDEAGQLLAELQQRPRQLRPRTDQRRAA